MNACSVPQHRSLKTSLYDSDSGERKKKDIGVEEKEERRGSGLKGAALVGALRFLIGWSDSSSDAF